MPTDLRQLLEDSSIVGAATLVRAEKLARLSGLSLGKSLISLDSISLNELEAALEARHMIDDGLISHDCACRAMQTVRRRGWNLTDSLMAIDAEAFTARRSRLGELFLDAGIVDDRQLEICLNSATFVGYPLGKTLTIFDTVDEALITKSLDWQKQLRLGQLDRKETLNRIRELHQSKTRIDRSGAKLEQLLEAAELSAATEPSTRKDGDVRSIDSLTRLHSLDRKTIIASVKLISLVQEGLISMKEAAKLLKYIDKYTDGSAQESPDNSLLDFLRQTGLLDAKRCRQLFDEMEETELKDPARLTEALLSRYREDTELIKSATVLYQLLQTKKLNREEALLTFGFLKFGLARS